MANHYYDEDVYFNECQQYVFVLLWARGLSHLVLNQEIAGSNPARSTVRIRGAG